MWHRQNNLVIIEPQKNHHMNPENQSGGEKGKTETERLFRRLQWTLVVVHGLLAVPLYCVAKDYPFSKVTTLSGVIGIGSGAFWSILMMGIALMIFVSPMFNKLSEGCAERNFIPVTLTFWNICYFGSFLVLACYRR
jgi:hypothetical protein